MGLRYLENGFISLSCMKLLYGHGNANSVAHLFGEFKEKILPLVTQIRNYTSNFMYSDEKIEKKDQNLKISLLSGLCFAWYKKSHPAQNNIGVTVPIESFCTDFFKKLAVNRELIKTNKEACFTKLRRDKVLHKIKKAFEEEGKEIDEIKLTQSFLDRVWNWIVNK